MYVSAHSQRGATREENQDTIGVGSWRNVEGERDTTEIQFSEDELPVLCLLADGIGGHSNGRLASRTAIDSIHRNFILSPAEFDAAQAISEAHTALVLTDNYSYRPMGTTVVGLSIGTEQIYLFNIGDSKAYRIRGSEMQELTVEDRHHAENSKAITQCLGGGIRRPQAHQLSVKYEPGDKFLMSSDGVTDHLSNKQILEVLAERHSNPAQNICNNALAMGGDDDISAICIEI
ncbi:protein phosphatase 2C domain-containing protein [Alphaproteobacteria bacterium]|nr:protein phosphatase 2C domain-containing protein [Alphaproteobacteria bacterium]